MLENKLLRLRKVLKKRMKLFGGTVPPPEKLFGGIVPPPKKLFGGTIPIVL